jgi:hypothetical protein
MKKKRKETEEILEKTPKKKRNSTSDINLSTMNLSKDIEEDINNFLADKFQVIDPKNFKIEKKKKFNSGGINPNIFTKENYFEDIFDCISNNFFETLLVYLNS